MVVLALIILLLTCLNFIFSSNRNKFYIFSAFLFAVVAFFIKPTEGWDLLNHYNFLHGFQRFGIGYFDYFPYTKSLPLFGIYFYLISFLQLDGFLPMITYLIVYLSLFKVLSMAREDGLINLASERIAFLYIIFLISFLDLSGIRNFMAFSISSVFLYIDLARGKKRVLSFLVYIALMFFHYSCIFIVMIRLLTFLSKRKIWFIVTIIIGVTWTLFQSQLSGFVSNLNNSNSFISLIKTYFDFYSKNDSSYLNPYISYVRLVTIVCFLVSTLFLYFAKKNYKGYPIQYVKFCILLICITLSSARTNYLFLRLATLCCMLLPILVVQPKATERIQNNALISTSPLLMSLVVISLNGLVLFIYHYSIVHFF